MNRTPMNPTNDQERRAYWAHIMDQAFAFMEAIKRIPVQECGERLTGLPEAAGAAGVEVAFSTTEIAPDLDRVFYLREGLIDDFVAIARDMNDRGWILKVEDGLRSTEMQRQLGMRAGIFDIILQRTMWELGGEVPTPEQLFKRVTALVATCPKIGTHISASAIDVSVLNRDDGIELDRGGPYLELSELTPMESPFISAQALENRLAIRSVFEARGFMAYPFEFWHYNKGDAYVAYVNNTGEPAKYGPIHWDPATGDVVPVENPLESLHSEADVRFAIDEALARVW